MVPAAPWAAHLGSMWPLYYLLTLLLLPTAAV
jgi:hypothetical protein